MPLTTTFPRQFKIRSTARIKFSSKKVSKEFKPSISVLIVAIAEEMYLFCMFVNFSGSSPSR
jgi:hypothetical protein